MNAQGGMLVVLIEEAHRLEEALLVLFPDVRVALEELLAEVQGAVSVGTAYADRFRCERRSRRGNRPLRKSSSVKPR